MPINRYSQIVQPSVVNPITFEEFARVPMAKAQASAEALKATSGILTDYNVDVKDLDNVNTLVGAVDESKDNLVDNILNNGVNKQTISQFITVKEQRDKAYRNYINKAQENKLKLDSWRANVDKMSMQLGDPSYGELVKRKEYENWLGTFQEDGTVSDFVPNYGVKYVDVDKDIQQVMSQAAPTLTSEDLKGMSIQYISGLGRYMVTDKEGRLAYKNTPGLQSAADLLTREYGTSTTDRGAFAEYSELQPKDILGKIQNYFDLYKREDIKRYGGGRQFVAPPGMGGMQQQLQGYAPTSKTGLVPITYKTQLPTKANKFFSTFVQAGEEETGKKSFFGDAWKLALGPFGAIPAVKSAYDSWVKAEEVVGNKIYNPKNIIEQYDNVGRELVRLNKISSDLYKKAVSGDKNAQEDLADEIRDYVHNIAKKESQQSIFVGDYLRTEFGDKMKNDPVGAAKDIGTNIQGVSVYSASDRDKPITGDEKKELQTSLMKGEALVRGVVPGGSDLTTNNKGDYIRDLSQGYIVSTPEGEEYIVGRIWEPNEPRNTELGYKYHMNADVEQYTFQIPLGVEAPIFILNDKGEKVQAIYYHNPVNARKEIHISDGKGGSQAFEFSAAFGRLVPPEEFYKN